MGNLLGRLSWKMSGNFSTRDYRITPKTIGLMQAVAVVNGGNSCFCLGANWFEIPVARCTRELAKTIATTADWPVCLSITGGVTCDPNVR